MADRVEKCGWLAVAFFTATFWFALVIGVSFLATTAKFLAPSLTLPVALDVGMHTFRVLNKVEWVLAALLLLIVLGGTRSKFAVLAAAIAVLCVVAETFWLYPILDQRTAMIIAGSQPPKTIHHGVFVYLQGLKLVLLLVVIFAAAMPLVRKPKI
ncbi:MAG TPA: hypothetical protein VNR41_07330 [Xanthobacteraceae bacterium]|nr:hypothetical protein [Xanthobacteraceae bacterium]